MTTSVWQIKNNRRTKYLVPFFLGFTFFLVGLWTLSDYGMVWDAPTRMLRGQTYAHFLLTGKKSYDEPVRTPPLLIKPLEYISRYLYLVGENGTKPASLPPRPLLRAEFESFVASSGGGRPSFYHHDEWGGKLFFYKDPGHPPFIDILAAFSNRLFWGAFGLLGDIESYQLVYVFIGAIGVFLVSLFAYEITLSYGASFVAGLSLGFFPLFLGESHTNMKDPIQAVFFMGSVWAFWHFVKENSVRWFWVFAAFIALALSVKWNIIFLPFILVPWLLLIRFKSWRKLGILAMLGGLGVILFLIMSWPYMWSSPFSKLAEVVGFYWGVGIGPDRVAFADYLLPFGISIFPLVIILSQTPDIILVLTGMGIVVILSNRANHEVKIGYLLLFWFFITLIRESITPIGLHGGIRQFMEIIPVIALLSGVGFAAVLKIRHQMIKICAISLTLILFISLIIRLIQIHPNQNAFFNQISGGINKANERGLIDWSLTYGNVYKQGVEWINTHAEKDANIAHLDGPSFAISPLWLREDISLSPYHFSDFEQKGEYIMVLNNPSNPPFFAYRYLTKFLQPVHTISIDGFPLLWIYKNDRQYLKKDFGTEKTIRNVFAKPIPSDEGDFWQVNLDREYKVSGITVQSASSDCLSEQSDYIQFSNAETYIFNERKKEGNQIKFFFPAEITFVIRIFPKSFNSCFATGKIKSVSYLE